MAGAIIVIDQPSGAGAGSPGVARNDLWQLQQINLSCASSNTTYQWDLLDVPPGSGATLTGPSTSTPNFLPDLIGTYRIQLITNGGGPGNVQILIIRVRYNSTGVLQNRGWAPPAFGEQSGESNYAGNLRGWAEDMEFILEDVRANVGSGTVNPTPSTLSERGTSGEGLFVWLAATATSTATSGLLRLTSAVQAAVAARNAANSNNVALIGIDGSDGVVCGDATNGASTTLKCAGSTIGNLFVQVHASFGLGVWGDATNGVAIGSSGGPCKLLATRTCIGFGSFYSQLIRTPRAWNVGGAGGPLAIDFDQFGTNPDLTLTANSTLNAPMSVVAGGRYTLTVRQTGGPWTMTWDAAFHFGSAFNGTLTSSTGAVDIFEFMGDSSGVLYCVGASKGVQ